MDRRRLKGRSLQKNNFSVNIPLTKNTERPEIIARSASIGGELLIEQNNEKRDSSPEINMSARKKRKCNPIQDPDESIDEKLVSQKRSQKPGPLSSKLKRRSDESNHSDQEQDDNMSISSRSSHMSNILASWNAGKSSPSKSSASSQDFKQPPRRGGRRLNLRTPVRPSSQSTNTSVEPNLNNSMSKTKEKEKAKEKPTTPKVKQSTIKNILSKASEKKTAKENLIQDLEEDEENLFSDLELEVQPKRQKNSRTESEEVNDPKPTPAKKSRQSKEDNLLLELDDSPMKITKNKNVTLRKKKDSRQQQEDNAFLHLLNISGIFLSTGEALHSANADQQGVIKNIKNFLDEGVVDKEEFIKQWQEYIEDEEMLAKSLHELKIETNDGVELRSRVTTLVKILIHVPQLQVPILDSLIRKLIDAIITTDSAEEAPWAQLLLQQIRFMEVVVEPEFVINKLEELLQAAPEWFQREVVVFIPDIVSDMQHQVTAELLVKLMEKNKDLTNIVLDCIHNLILGKDYREELRGKVISTLQNDVDKANMPSITGFILHDCSSEATAFRSLSVLRKIDMEPKPTDNVNECYTHQNLMINAIKMSILLSKDVVSASMSILKSTESEAEPLDFILCFLLYDTTPTKKKAVETLFLSHIKDGHYKISLLQKFYKGYKPVAKSFESTTLTLAINLLKTNNRSYVEFGIAWMRNLFIVQEDQSYKQRDIMEKILLLLGNKDKTVKNALDVLCKMADDQKERKYLQQHAGYLRLMLEKIDNLPFNEVFTLYHLLHQLCTTSDSISDVLQDDLSIIMQKQLSSSNTMTKCKGVLGSIMAIKHLAQKSESQEQALEIFKKVLASVRTCVRSQGLFYDKLSQILSTTENLNTNFLARIIEVFEGEFIENCLVEPDNYHGPLVPKFDLNTDESNNFYVNFGETKNSSTIPVLFKLLRICHLCYNGNLEGVNAILGCAILMPSDLDIPEPTIADSLMNCINWFREIIGGFVTQEDPHLRRQVLKRLESLMNLQGELVTILPMCEAKYQPNSSYFHYFPPPPFVITDKKVSKKKKGKKGNADKSSEKSSQKSSTVMNTSIHHSSPVPEWEMWERGSQMTIKNSAYFRQLDAKIINLLDVNMNMELTQTTSENVSISQVCFIIKELLGMFENEVSESFIQDLINLMPKICSKLQKIVEDLRSNDSVYEKEAVRLLLCLLTAIFSWKEFDTARYNNLLRDGLRHLARMVDESNGLLRACKDLLTQAYNYFESLADISTDISLAVALVNMCACLMKHSDTFMRQTKEKQAKLSYAFLCLEWSSESFGPQYRAAIKELLKSWMDNEADPLQCTSTVLEWLPGEVEDLDRPNSRLNTLPSITKVNLHLLIRQIFIALVKGIEESLKEAERDPERIKIWLTAANALDHISTISKATKNNAILILYLRYTSILYQLLHTHGMKVLELNMKYQTEDVMNIIKLFQKAGRLLRDIFCTARKDRNVALLTLIPLVKSKREQFIYSVKGLMAINNSVSAFWMGNLLNKDLDGEEILSEAPDDITSMSANDDNNTVNDASSEVYNSEISDLDEEDADS